MVDVHSHILPHFDDGAATTKISMEMLRESKRQGVDKIISTSHCYPRTGRSINEFIYDRTESLVHLKYEIEKSGEDLPRIYSGCELNLSRDISDDAHLRELCTEGTDYLLLEMPYAQWQPWCIEAVYKVTLRGITPVMAHIDRFLSQKRDMLNSLFELDVLYQVNAEAFLDRRMRKNVDMLFETGKIHFIGSDMHNMDIRRPNLGEARERILKSYGEDYLRYLEENNERLIRNEEIDTDAYKSLQKRSFFGKFFHAK
ncbi:MAG: hypothetical protein Q4G33_00915 [bacterium]|nr:hypothetical protein [bacterium]